MKQIKEVTIHHVLRLKILIASKHGW